MELVRGVGGDEGRWVQSLLDLALVVGEGLVEVAKVGNQFAQWLFVG